MVMTMPSRVFYRIVIRLNLWRKWLPENRSSASRLLRQYRGGTYHLLRSDYQSARDASLPAGSYNSWCPLMDNPVSEVSFSDTSQNRLLNIYPYGEPRYKDPRRHCSAPWPIACQVNVCPNHDSSEMPTQDTQEAKTLRLKYRTDTVDSKLIGWFGRGARDDCNIRDFRLVGTKKRRRSFSFYVHSLPKRSYVFVGNH